MKLAVSWVVVAFHRPESLRRMLAAAMPDVEVIVVNIEGDPAVTAAATEARSDATVIETATNVGYAAGVNLGVDAARADVVVFSNDDLVVPPDGMAALAAVVAAGEADVALPALRLPTGEREPAALALPSPWALLKEWALLPDRRVSWLDRCLVVEKWRQPMTAERIEAGTAAIVAVRRDVLLEEPMPESYFLYWEEMEWFWRLATRGLIVQARPEIEVVHLGGRDDVRPDKSRLLARNAVRCVRRTQGRMAAVRGYAAVLLWQVRLVFVDGLRASAGRCDVPLRSRVAGFSAAAGSWRELA